MFRPSLLPRFLCAGLLASCALAVTAAAPAGSGKVLPPSATPLGFSIDDMAGVVADFSISGNDLDFYPGTPFQIIYRHPGMDFTVDPGTYLYVKVFFTDDSEPVIGDFPTDKSDVGDYVFGSDQLGGHDLQIIVDGNPTSLDDPGYAGFAETPTSPDGSAHIVQIAGFVSPLNKGVHTLQVKGVFDGDAILDFFGAPLVGDLTFTITVK